MLSAVMEDYLKVIYQLERDGDGRVSTSSLAEYLDVSPPTVTSMATKLDERGLVSYEKYGGVKLTEEGETVALEVLRHHRLIEAYLTEHLDYDWSEVHDEADALEHHISEEFERRIAAALGDPEVDPHGDPIPDTDLSPVEDDTSPLSTYEEGEQVVVARVGDREPEELRYLADLGIEPGSLLSIESITPIGTYVVANETGVQHLPEHIAIGIRVQPVPDEELIDS